MSRWMGVFWVGLGIFLLISSWLGQSSFVIPHININLGWVVIALGVFRIWWWWKTEEEPRRHKLEVRAEQRQFNLEMSRALEEQEAAKRAADSDDGEEEGDENTEEKDDVQDASETEDDDDTSSEKEAE